MLYELIDDDIWLIRQACEAVVEMGKMIGRAPSEKYDRLTEALQSPVDMQARVDAVRDYLNSDRDRCFPTCRVGCPCDGGQQDAATGAFDAAQEIVSIVVTGSVYS